MWMANDYASLGAQAGAIHRRCCSSMVSAPALKFSSLFPSHSATSRRYASTCRELAAHRRRWSPTGRAVSRGCSADALDKLGYEVVDVLGISLGGAIAQQFAWQHAERTRRVVLVSTGTGAIMVPGTPSALFSMLTPRRFTDPDYMVGIAPGLYGGRVRTSPEMAAGLHREPKPGSAFGYYGQVLGLLGWTSIHWLSRLRQPTLILSGADDPIVPPINARIMSWLIPNSRLHIFDDGHLGLLTSVDELAPIVHDFLATVDTISAVL